MDIDTSCIERDTNTARGFDELVSYHTRINHVISPRMDCSHESDDVVQEVFLSALTNLRGFRGEGRLSGWLTHIAINKCCSHWRKLSARRKALAGAAGAKKWAAPAQPETLAMDRETFGRVRQAVQALPRHYRQVVDLWYLKEIPIAEVAGALAISPALVRLRLHRARRHLRYLLADLADE